MPSTLQIAAVIPTYNRAALIARAIDSVLHQTVPPAEVIVVDDGSTDNTAEVCAGYGDRVKYSWHKNGGASASRNLGIRFATKPWIAFLDSDDYWDPGHLERMTAAIRQTDGQANLYFSDMQLPEEDGGRTLWTAIGFRPQAPIHLSHDATAWALMKRQPMMLQSSMISKRALDEMGGLDVRLRVIHDCYVFCQLSIGRAVCAVSGVGCVQTSDDTSAVRLTTAIPLRSIKNASEHSIMWPNVLANTRLPPAFRRLVRLYVASSRWEAGKELIGSRKYIQGVASLVRAFSTDPGLAWWVLRKLTREGYESAVRPTCSEYVPRPALDAGATSGRD